MAALKGTVGRSLPIVSSRETQRGTYSQFPSFQRFQARAYSQENRNDSLSARPTLQLHRRQLFYASLSAPLLLSVPGASAEDSSDAILPSEIPQLDLQLTEIEAPADVTLPADVSFLDDDSAVLAAGLAVGAALFLGALSLLLNRGYAGDIPPEQALELVEAGEAILLDVRPGKEKREDGSPLVKAGRGQVGLVAVQYLKSIGGDEFEPDENFVENVKGGKALELEGNLIVVDSSGSVEIAVAAAKALTSGGVRNVRVLKGGSDAWKDAGLPWRDPLLSLPSLPSVSVNQEQIQESLKAVGSNVSAVAEETGKALPGALAAVAIAGAAVAVVAEAEALLQLAASVTAGQFLVRKFLFKKDRDETIAQLKALVVGDKDTDRAAEETSREPSAAKSLATDAALATASVASGTAAPAQESAPSTLPTPAKAPSSTDLPPSNRPLSPYTTYPDLKPPTSPTPRPPE